jgi:uncharacterized DUF497 family protein
MGFRWLEWNIDHIERHGVDAEDAERVVRGAKAPYPLEQGDDKWLVRGQGRGGRYLQVAYLVDEDDTLFVIHARPLTDSEKRRFRRKRRK